MVTTVKNFMIMLNYRIQNNPKNIRCSLICKDNPKTDPQTRKIKRIAKNIRISPEKRQQIIDDLRLI